MLVVFFEISNKCVAVRKEHEEEQEEHEQQNMQNTRMRKMPLISEEPNCLGSANRQNVEPCAANAQTCWQFLACR